LRFARAGAPWVPAWSPRSPPRAGEAVMRDLISLQCEQCRRRNYTTSKNKKRTTGKLAFSKFCPACRTHTPHKEAKV
jgi:large subunit ribosomal protein L33